MTIVLLQYLDGTINPTCGNGAIKWMVLYTVYDCKADSAGEVTSELLPIYLA